MKRKWIVFALVFVALAGTAACGVDDMGNLEQEYVQTETQEPPLAQDLPDAQEPTETQEPADEQDLSEAQEPVEVEYIRISPQETQEMMLAEDVVILDVRSQGEFDEGHIPGAVLLPHTEIRENAHEVLPDFDQIILVYCRAGSRSATASRTLIELGYTRVYDFGGIDQWQGEVVT